ncbi:MAG: dephospho-CoA kinase [Geobacter sp.]|nr:dephospho-CoA kinase [Geobacter sp.]
MRVIGLTGGIASGKSTVARLLEQLGAKVIDADQLARETVRPGQPAYEEIVREFGAAILAPDGTINRKALGGIVFADPAARRRLETITHPAIGRLAEEYLARYRASSEKVVFYMAPLLIEAGVTSRVEEIWVVYADPETQVQRVMARDSVSRDEALQRLAAQMPMHEKVRFGRVVIDNTGTLEELEMQVSEVWEREIAGRPETGNNEREVEK